MLFTELLSGFVLFIDPPLGIYSGCVTEGLDRSHRSLAFYPEYRALDPKYGSQVGLFPF